VEKLCFLYKFHLNSCLTSRLEKCQFLAVPLGLAKVFWEAVLHSTLKGIFSFDKLEWHWL